MESGAHSGRFVSEQAKACSTRASRLIEIHVSAGEDHTYPAHPAGSFRYSAAAAETAPLGSTRISSSSAETSARRGSHLRSPAGYLR